MSDTEFSIEQSEDFITNFKSSRLSEFEQLRSALNLLAHVPAVSPIESPPVLPSTISQPSPVVPIKSSKSRRTAVTSIIVMGIFASGSLAAAAVTGIGPSVFVNAGHSAAKFVKNVVGVSNAGPSYRSNPRPVSDNTSPNSALALTNPILNDEGKQNDSEGSTLPLISKLIPPLPSTILINPSPNEGESQTSSHDKQGQSSDESQKKTPEVKRTQSSSEEQNQTDSQPSDGLTPTILPTPEISIQPAPITLPTESSDDSQSND